MNGDQALITIYTVYAVLAIGLIVWVARTLEHNGEPFLRQTFHEDPDLAAAVNRLLVVGFYLFNLGYALLILRSGRTEGALEAVEVLIAKLGLLLVSLGAIHLVNLWIFWRIGRSRPRTVMPTPPAPYPAGAWPGEA